MVIQLAVATVQRCSLLLPPFTQPSNLPHAVRHTLAVAFGGEEVEVVRRGGGAPPRAFQRLQDTHFHPFTNGEWMKTAYGKTRAMAAGFSISPKILRHLQPRLALGHFFSSSMRDSMSRTSIMASAAGSVNGLRTYSSAFIIAFSNISMPKVRRMRRRIRTEFLQASQKAGSGLGHVS